MAKSKPFTTEAELRLERLDLKAPWVLKWPHGIQDAAFAVPTHDEIMRFPGLREFLHERVGVVPVTLTISTIRDA